MMIALTGFMGSGKTTVGKVLADFLGCPFMDLDDLVVKKAGKSIPDIFAQDGEPAFRELEAQILRKTVAKYAESTAVLALGGGAVLAPASAALLHEPPAARFCRRSPIRSGMTVVRSSCPAPTGHLSPQDSPPANPSMKKPPMSSLTRTVCLRTKSRTRLSSRPSRTMSSR